MKALGCREAKRNVALPRTGGVEPRNGGGEYRGDLARTLLVVIACLPIFALGELFNFSLLPPFILLCFGVAMVWFLRPLAWVVMLMLAVIGVLVLAGSLEERASYFSDAHYLRYEMLSGDSWALVALAATGATVLLWLAIATLRQRIRPALEQDFVDGGDDA